jgi:hypothetical protein
MNFRDVDDTKTWRGEIPALAAIQRLCNTGSAGGGQPSWCGSMATNAVKLSLLF